MHDPTHTDSRSPPRSGGVTTRASTEAHDDTAQPAVTSGFGTVIEKEQMLLRTTEGCFGQYAGEHAAGLNRILRNQHARLGANIALLEQRYEALPNPERFVNWHSRGSAAAPPRSQPQAQIERLPELVTQHARLRADIEALILRSPDGQRGELILNEVSRSHEEMAWMLNALVMDDASAKIIEDERGGGREGDAIRAQEAWANEGGSAHTEPPMSSAEQGGPYPLINYKSATD